MTIKEKYEVMAAYTRGESIEYRKLSGGAWSIWGPWPLSGEPGWDWHGYEYRVALPAQPAGNPRTFCSKQTHKTMTTKEKIEVMAAHTRGEPIEFRPLEDGPLSECWDRATDPSWDWSSNEYRVAPPKSEKFFALPDGVFWVRSLSRPDAHRLCIGVDKARIYALLLRSGSVIPIPFKSLEAKCHWSHDRKAWFTFTGEPVAP